MYRQKLADKISEKMLRAQSIKGQRELVKTAYSSQLHNITMYHAARATMRETTTKGLKMQAEGLASGA
jgi:hypothetical protein